jgi:hypothetical protein
MSCSPWIRLVAIFGVTPDPLMVFTFKVAVLGLRATSSFSLSVSRASKYLPFGLARCRAFADAKMLIARLYEISITRSLFQQSAACLRVGTASNHETDSSSKPKY